MDNSIILFNRRTFVRIINYKKLYIVNNFFNIEELNLLKSSLANVTFIQDEQSTHNRYVDVSKISNSEQSTQLSDLLEEKKKVLKNLIESFYQCSIGEEYLGTIIQYGKGWRLPRHADCWSNLPTYSGYPSRDISSIIYLSDNFVGGNLFFSDLELNIEPSEGSAIIFPSSEDYMHEVTEVISGDRLAITSFWHIM